MLAIEGSTTMKLFSGRRASSSFTKRTGWIGVLGHPHGSTVDLSSSAMAGATSAAFVALPLMPEFLIICSIYPSVALASPTRTASVLYVLDASTPSMLRLMIFGPSAEDGSFQPSVPAESVLEPMKNTRSAVLRNLLEWLVPPLAPTSRIERGCLSEIVPFPVMVQPTGMLSISARAVTSSPASDTSAPCPHTMTGLFAAAISSIAFAACSGSAIGRW